MNSLCGRFPDNLAESGSISHWQDLEEVLKDKPFIFGSSLELNVVTVINSFAIVEVH